MNVRALALPTLLAAALVAAGGLSALPRPAGPAVAAAAGVVTGVVTWCAPLPVPYGAPTQPGMAPEAAPNGSSELAPEASPEAAPEMMPDASGFAMPGVRPIAPRLIPAGAVLVAVQGTALSARTDENGRFRIEGVPAGQYLTIAAGPVRQISTAIAVRPNVFIQDTGQTVDVGRLSLGQQCGYGGPIPYAVPGASGAEPGVQPEGSP
ncbi:MAG: carboxypeptidase regulatory-like domain-containing protein [Chloroflexi bacterium]|nr:carboxypeptidase regulatory-like domain-containing protein [Chloroflexota bacterium]